MIRKLLLLLLTVGMLAKHPGGGDPPGGDSNGKPGETEEERIQREMDEMWGTHGGGSTTLEEAFSNVDREMDAAENSGSGGTDGDGDSDKNGKEDKDEKDEDPEPPPDDVPFGANTDGDQPLAGGEYSLDESVELIAGHAGDDDPTMGRPTRSEIEDALRNATPEKLPGQNAYKYEHNGVRVIVNNDNPLRSTTYYPGR